MAVFTSYENKGNKLSFANWISNLSPVDTFFVSVTGKEETKNKKFQWQTDTLETASLTNAQIEGADVNSPVRQPTQVQENLTQILRKVVEVTDTADEVDSYGRDREIQYQMEKAGKELKRDLEKILLSDQAQVAGNNSGGGTPRKTAAFEKLVATLNSPQDGTGAIVHKETAVNTGPSEVELFELTKNLYLAGSSANIIMYHPNHATFFSSLMESGAGRQKLIANMDTTLNKFVGTLIDPLGQEYKLVPNRFMPEKRIYFFNPKDWTQMVLRSPERVKLAKLGSTERYMIEMEVGLRHANPYASGILAIKA